MRPDYNRGNIYFGDVEVKFVYTDISTDEPEINVIVLEGIYQSEMSIMDKIKKRFSPVEILDITSFGTVFGEAE